MPDVIKHLLKRSHVLSNIETNEVSQSKPQGWAPTTKADLEPLSGARVFGYVWWRKDWEEVSSELKQDRLAWGVSVRDVVNSIWYAGSTHP